MPKTLKKKCCKSYRKKGKACSHCPLMARLEARERGDLLARHRSEHKTRKKRMKRLKKLTKKLEKLRKQERKGKKKKG